MGTSTASADDMDSCSRYSNRPCACGRPSKNSSEAALSSKRPTVPGGRNCKSNHALMHGSTSVAGPRNQVHAELRA